MKFFAYIFCFLSECLNFHAFCHDSNPLTHPPLSSGYSSSRIIYIYMEYGLYKKAPVSVFPGLSILSIPEYIKQLHLVELLVLTCL